MIAFLNFAPIHYFGGAERHMYELFLVIQQREKTVMVCMNERIASIYGRIVLRQAFENRQHEKAKFNKHNYISLSVMHFIPYTKQRRSVVNTLSKARVIYVKGEVNELLILFLLGNTKYLKKTVIGVRSPWLYLQPKGIFDHLHNIVYKSFLARYILSLARKIHVLNIRDKDFFERKMKLRNIVYIPLHTEIPKLKAVHGDTKKYVLKVIFIGELVIRKGIDYLVKVIEKAPSNFTFDIVGKGPMEVNVRTVTAINKNCTYHGYLKKEKVFRLLSQNDVLFFPSRAEGFGAVILEAMAVGLKVVDSPEISLGLPKYIEYTPKAASANGYLHILKNIYKEKMTHSLEKDQIKRYCEEKFSEKNIMPILLRNLFSLN